MSTNISETVSKKRGRPAAFDPAWVAIVAGLHPELRSKRQIIAKCYETTAIGILGDCDGVSGIFDKAQIYHGTILEQLGRIQVDGIASDQELCTAAEWVSSRLVADPAFTVRHAVALLRLLRQEIAARYLLGIEKHPTGKLLRLLHDED